MKVDIDVVQQRAVFIATPTYRDFAPGYVVALAGTIAMLEQIGVHYEFSMRVGMPVADARNALVEQFLNGSCSDILFIDADMGWAPLDVLRLLSSGRAVVGGSGRRKAPGEPQWCHTPDVLKQDEPGFLAVEDVGAAFLLVNRVVFGRLRRNCFSRDGDLGEDISFCHRCQRAGFPVSVDTTINLSHYGTYDYCGAPK